jgi:hypothetical protein
MVAVETAIVVRGSFVRITSVSLLVVFPMRGVRSASAVRIVEWGSFVTRMGAAPSAVGPALARQVAPVMSGQVNAREGQRRRLTQVRLQMMLEALRILAQRSLST